VDRGLKNGGKANRLIQSFVTSRMLFAGGMFWSSKSPMDWTEWDLLSGALLFVFWRFLYWCIFPFGKECAALER